MAILIALISELTKICPFFKQEQKSRDGPWPDSTRPDPSLLLTRSK